MEYFCSAEVDGIPSRFRVRCSEAGPVSVFHRLGGTEAIRELPAPAVAASLQAQIEWGGIPVPAELTHLSHIGAGFRIRSRVDAGDAIQLVVESPSGDARLEAEVKLVRGPTASGRYVGWLEILSADRLSRARWLRLVAEGDPLLNPPTSPKKQGRARANRSLRSASL